MGKAAKQVKPRSPYTPHIERIAKLYVANGENAAQTVRDINAWGGHFANMKALTLYGWIAKGTHGFPAAVQKVKDDIARDAALERATDERKWVPEEIKQAQADLLDIRIEVVSAKQGDKIPYCDACKRGPSRDGKAVVVLAEQARKQGDYILSLQEFGLAVRNPKNADVANEAVEFFLDRIRRVTEGRPDLRAAFDEVVLLMEQTPQ